MSKYYVHLDNSYIVYTWMNTLFFLKICGYTGMHLCNQIAIDLKRKKRPRTK